MEDYAAKMLLKPDAALREYVTGHAQYREAAVLAALAELRRRGQPAPEEAALRPALEAAVAEQAAQQAAAPAETVADDSADDAAAGPVLYSPGTIAVFTVLFPIVGGAALLGLNLLRVRRWGGLGLLAGFVTGYLLLASALVLALLGSGPLVLLVLPLVLAVPAIAVYVGWFWPRYFGRQPYQGRGWLLPLLLGIALQVALPRVFQPLNDYLLKQQPKELQNQFRPYLQPQ